MCSKFTKDKKFRLSSACAECAGGTESILFAVPLNSFFSRSMVHLHIVIVFLNSVIDADRRRKENFVPKDDSDIYEDDSNILGELASTLADNSHRQYKRETFIVSIA